jgi:hypothetical protein
MFMMRVSRICADYEYCIQPCGTVWSAGQATTFWKYVLPPFAKKKNNLYPEAEDSGILRRVETSVPSLSWIRI